MGKMKRLKKRKRKKTKKKESRSTQWFSTFKFTHEQILEDHLKKLPEDILQQYYESFWSLDEDPGTAVSILEKLLEKYPDIPEFKNNLAVAYGKMGDNIKAKLLIDENYRMNPDYLFGKTAYAQLCLTRKRYDDVPKIFDNYQDLQLLYPDRELFHITEIMTFYSLWGLYYFRIGKLEQARVYYKLIRKYGPDDEMTKHLGKLLSGEEK